MSFKRYPRHRKKRLGDAWRRPRGWQNKLRLEKKGHGKRVKVGYRTKADERHTKNGLEVVTVYNADDVKALDAKEQGAVIGNVGMRKEIIILKAIRDADVTLLTGDVAERLKELEGRFQSRRKSREEREKEREAKLKELEKKAEQVEDDKSDLEEAADEAADADSDTPEDADKPKKDTKAKKKTKTEKAEQDDTEDEQKKEKDKVLTKAR